jgi:hypothetical protein
MIEDQQVKMFNSGIVTDRAVVRFWMDVGSACSLFLTRCFQHNLLHDTSPYQILSIPSTVGDTLDILTKLQYMGTMGCIKSTSLPTCEISGMESPILFSNSSFEISDIICSCGQEVCTPY